MAAVAPGQVYLITMQLSLPISSESRFRRSVRGANAYAPVKTGFAGNAYTPANEISDGGAHMERVGYVTISRTGVYIYNSIHQLLKMSWKIWPGEIQIFKGISIIAAHRVWNIKKSH